LEILRRINHTGTCEEERRMAVIARANIIRTILAGLIALFVSTPCHPGPCLAESGTAVPAEETFVLPENKVLWTRDGNPAGTELTWAEAHTFLNGLNRKKFGGCERWRMPSRGELTQMLAYLDSGNADDEDISPEQGYYWSSSVDPLRNDYADAVSMEDGSVDSCEKSEINYVWPVCGQ
jgi:hypothetical protein